MRLLAQLEAPLDQLAVREIMSLARNDYKPLRRST